MSGPPDSRDPASKLFRARPKGDPVVRLPAERARRTPRTPAPPYAELAAQSCFSFLRAASFPEELVAAAHALGLQAVAITDRNTLSGVVRAHVEAKKRGMRLVIGTRLAFCDGTPDILAFPEDRAGYARLSRLLTVGNLKPHVVKAECDLTLPDLLEHCEGLLLALIPPERPDERLSPVLAQLRTYAPGRVWLAVQMRRGAEDARRLTVLKETALRTGAPLLAIGDVLHHSPERKPLLDVMTCIREHVTLAEAGRRLESNAERHLKSPREMAEMFKAAPDALGETLRLLERARFTLDEIVYEYPGDDIPGGVSAQHELERRTWAAVCARYGDAAPATLRDTLAHELRLIAQMEYAQYFLTVHNIVVAARNMEILCQGRGSAANSAVCFVLGITAVDPANHGLLFERFISPERNEPPDIDVDFEHERREDVIQWIYSRYGRERAAIAATVITYRARSALEEVGKVFGVSEDATKALRSVIWGWSNTATDDAEVRRVGLDPQDPNLARMLGLAREIIGFPRHLSQHTGGFVVTKGRLDEIVPIGKAAMPDRTFIEWDKDDLDAMGLLKIDVLALGSLTMIRKAFDLIEREYGRSLQLADIPQDDPDVYAMTSRADTLGVFQIESRAQMSMLPRLRPKVFYDLVIQVAIVRPGPIQGNMVHPYLRRREQKEAVSYPSPALREVLEKTLGVPLFQEQAMKIAIVAAGFSPPEADKLRRAMATFRNEGTIAPFREKFISGMIANGYPLQFAEDCFSQIEGFGSYGFPESHAASFASLAYVTAWLKCRYPDAFAAGLLNSLPMGFYAPAQIVRDAAEHGVEVRPVDVTFSDWDHTLEPGPDPNERLHARHAAMRGHMWGGRAVRLGLRQVKGLPEAEGRAISACRGLRLRSLEALWRASGVGAKAIELLAEADAFGAMGLSRRQALWEARALDGRRLGPSTPQQEAVLTLQEPSMSLPPQTEGEAVVDDYRRNALSLKQHPMSFLRSDLTAQGVVAAEQLADLKDGSWVKVAGLVLVRQMPGTAGVVFVTLEDETSIANIIVWPKVYETFRPEVIGSRCLAVTGRLQKEREVIHVIAYKIEDRSALLNTLSARGGEISALANADEVRRPQTPRSKKRKPLPASPPPPRHPRDQQIGLFDTASVMPKGRNFH